MNGTERWGWRGEWPTTFIERAAAAKFCGESRLRLCRTRSPTGGMSSAPPPLEAGAVLRALAGAISDVVVVLDRDGRYLDVVSRRAELLIRPASELLGRTIHDVFPRENADAFVRWI